MYFSLEPSERGFPCIGEIDQNSNDYIADNTADCEHSFSALKRIKSNLRLTMCEQRLTNLADLSVEREISCVISHDKVIDTFARMDQNRKILLM